MVHLRKDAAGQGISENEVLEKGLKEKSVEFAEKVRKFTPRTPFCIPVGVDMLNLCPLFSLTFFGKKARQKLG